MSRLKTLVRNQDGVQPLRGGHSFCQGCGIPMVVRTVLSTIETPVVVVNATGCLEVATTRYPTTAWNVPWMHVAFENAAAVAGGVESGAARSPTPACAARREPVTFVVFAGDGGTYDIGLQALSGALERGHRFLFVCYDNEAYMNTGIQRSGATPFGANTTTSPVGPRELRQGAAAEGHDGDRRRPPRALRRAGCRDPLARPERKVERAVAADGPAFLNVLTDCPLGWGHEPRLGRAVIDAAVEMPFWPLYEVVDGSYRLTYRPAKRRSGRALALRPEALRPPASTREPDARRADPAAHRDDWEALVARCA